MVTSGYTDEASGVKAPRHEIGIGHDIDD